MPGTSHAGRGGAAGGSATVAVAVVVGAAAGSVAGVAGSTTVGASSSAIARSRSAESAPNPCGRSAGFLAVQRAIRLQTDGGTPASYRSEEHTSELQSLR